MAPRNPEQEAALEAARERYNVALDRLEASGSEREFAEELLAVGEALSELLHALEGEPATQPDTD